MLSCVAPCYNHIMNITPYPIANELIASCLSDIQCVLGQKLAGLYLFGSLVTGDFDEQISDIDLLAATSSELDDADLDRLRQMHDDLSRRYPEWEDRIEVAYVSTTALRTFRSQRSKIGIISPGEPLHFVEAGSDWLINWYVVREYGVALFGPPPQAIIAPIPREEFVQTADWHARTWGERIKDWPARRPAQAYAVLTMCRALYTHTHGEQVSKKQAAQWAMQELPKWSSLIQRALVWRAEWREAQIEDAAGVARTRQFVDAVIGILAEPSQNADRK